MALNTLTLANSNLSGSGTVAVNGLTAGSSVTLTSNPEGAFFFDGANLIYNLPSSYPRTLHPVLLERLGTDQGSTTFSVNVAGAFAPGPTAGNAIDPVARAAAADAKANPTLTSAAIVAAGGDTDARAAAAAARAAIPASIFYNLKASNTAKFRSGMQRADRNCIVRDKGPSTVAGQSTGAAATQAIISPPVRTAAILQAQGINAGSNTAFGDKGNWGGAQTLAATIAGDARLASTGAAMLGSTMSLGGNSFVLAAAGSISFTPVNPVTRFEIMWRDNTAGRNFTATIDGGTATAINSSGTTALRRTLLPAVALGIHTCRLDWVALGCTIEGFYAYDDTNGRREITFINDGISGAQSSRFVDNTDVNAGNNAVYAILSPDCTFMADYSINDWRNSISLATSKANLTADVIAAKAYGDVVLFTDLWDGGTGGLSANQNAYAAMKYEVANEQDVPLVDMRALLLSFASETALGQVSDSVHPTPLGYNVIAAARAELVKRIRAF